MSNVLHGFSTAAKEMPVRYGFDKTRGTTTIRSFRGTSSQIAALETAYKWAGWSTEVTEGPTWTLVATLAYDDRSGSGAEVPVDTWELFANVVEKDILSSNTSVITGLSSAKKMYLRDVLDGKVEVKDLDCSTQAKTPTVLYGDTNSVQLFEVITGGTKSKRINIPTLRHTKTASSDYQFASALTGVDYAYSKSALGNAELIPSWIYNNIAATPGTNPFTRTDGIIVFAGWMKRYPQVMVSANSRSQIVTEWEYGEWATIVHPDYYE
jgi:hypothetical protein